MTIKKAVLKIHLWLGLASGLVIVVLGITGCILAFEREIRNISDPELFVAARDQAFLPPEQLKGIAEKELPGKKINTLEYPGKDNSALASYYDEEENYFIVAIDPYNGEVKGVKDMSRDFFHLVLHGHYYLWLPPSIGQPVVASATLIFLVMLITGLILWWPKNKAARKQRFTVKWNARWRRVNYDLHSIFGFYMTWVVIFIVITGLVWGFEWFAKSFYGLTSLGKSMPEYSHPLSDSTRAGENAATFTNALWTGHLRNTGPKESISVAFPLSDADPLQVTINHKPGTYYDTETFHYDQHTGVLLEANGYDAGSFRNASIPNKIKRLNYDIHVGAILGISGKIIAFFASLIAASLPVTGFCIWWGKRNKKKK